jgi:hypothetical protein
MVYNIANALAFANGNFKQEENCIMDRSFFDTIVENVKTKRTYSFAGEHVLVKNCKNVCIHAHHIVAENCVGCEFYATTIDWKGTSKSCYSVISQ